MKVSDYQFRLPIINAKAKSFMPPRPVYAAVRAFVIASKLLFSLFALCLFSSTLVNPLMAFGAGSDYVLTQRSHRFGDHYTYISPNGFRMTNPRSGFVLATRSATWKFYMYNEKSRMSYETTAEKWIHDIATGGEREALIGKWIRQPQKVNIFGLKATQYKLKGQLETRYLNSAPSYSQEVVGATYLIVEDNRVPPKMADLFSVIYNVPNLKGLPIALYYETAQGEKINRLETYRVTTSNLPAVYFDMPAGYHATDSFMTVMFGQPAQSQPAPSTGVNQIH